MQELLRTVTGKLVLAAGIAITLIVSGYIGYSGWRASHRADHQVMELATEKAGAIAQTIAAQVTEATSAGAALSGGLAGYMATGDATASDVIEILKGVPTQYDTVFSAWMAGLPDGATDDFIAGGEGRNDNGVFTPYWTKSTAGGLEFQTFPIETDAQWFALPVRGGKSIITEPYLSTENRLLTSVAVPVRVEGRIAGVAGVDIVLTDLTTMLGGLKTFEGGRVTLVDSGGKWLANPDETDLTQPYDEAGADLIMAALSDGEPRVIEGLPGGATRLVYPFTAPGMNTTWATLLDVPAAVFTAPVRSAVVEAVFSGVLILLMALATIYLTARSLVGRPLSDMLASVNKLASGQYGEQVRGTERTDDVGTMAASVEALREGLLQKEELEKDQERQQEEQARVVETLASSLRALAAGDLSRTIDDRFSGSYEALREDFNATINTLNDMMATLSESIREIRARSDEISAGSDELARRTESQAATLEETVAALDELTTSVRSAAEAAANVERSMADTRQDAQSSGAIVRDAIGAMSEIEKSSDEITQIIGVIDDIAFQTNLLALNAGVEAARAGEAGRGFAVVASEVRALAQRSSEAAKDIKQLIDSSSVQVEKGVGLVNRGGESLTGIVERVAKVADQMSAIATGANEQSVGLGEINVGATELDKVTQQNAAMVEETSAAAVNLQQEATALERQVERFTLRGGGGRSTAAPGVVPRPQAAAPAPRKAVVNGDGWQDF
ncbi:methyl-accepting chemotaxis sensory transducer with Cache sensor [Rhodovulum sp. ES.010]|uniref:methyl-accepting chemotaxis protein n=1 Tax=Rhodovulum sp. ES.010 TaxID=1882821 RepID=UPI000925B030|nr:methyl-accepting chemotaxis protein [Rhodovulum sp. ES.010]SIO56042.1 methyl-accepting chemotaxis sensory transducer with Cache sensor [Rhodovulum sp. ES.010]